MTSTEIEIIAKALYELDRQKGLRLHRWHVGAETKRERYRARARALLTGEDFAGVVARLEHRYWRTGHLVQERFQPVPVSSPCH